MTQKIRVYPRKSAAKKVLTATGRKHFQYLIENK